MCFVLYIFTIFFLFLPEVHSRLLYNNLGLIIIIFLFFHLTLTLPCIIGLVLLLLELIYRYAICKLNSSVDLI